jgi:hypothetical protein
MSVTFDEEQQVVRTPQTAVSGLYGLVIRWGFAKDAKGASMVLMIAAVSLAVFAIGLLVFGSGSSNTITAEEYLNNGNITTPPQP